MITGGSLSLFFSLAVVFRVPAKGFRETFDRVKSIANDKFERLNLAADSSRFTRSERADRERGGCCTQRITNFSPQVLFRHTYVRIVNLKNTGNLKEPENPKNPPRFLIWKGAFELSLFLNSPPSSPFHPSLTFLHFITSSFLFFFFLPTLAPSLG